MAALLLCALTACRLAGLGAAPDSLPPGTGGLSLQFGDAFARTLTPPIVMRIASFDIRGTGPDPLLDAFEVLGNTTGQLELVGLSPGQWLVEVEARNPYVEGDPNQAGTVIGYGRTDPPVSVSRGSVTPAQIVITPVAGEGTLALTLSFPPNTMKKSGYVQGTLVPAVGTALILENADFAKTPSNNPITASSSTLLEAGYYTLLLHLVRDDGSTWGTVEAVRIIFNQTTTGSWDLN